MKKRYVIVKTTVNEEQGVIVSYHINDRDQRRSIAVCGNEEAAELICTALNWYVEELRHTGEPV